MKTRDLINRYDLFATSVFGFNIGGTKTVGSALGLLCSLLVVTVTLAFSTVKMWKLVEGKNPNIAHYEQPDQHETLENYLDM